MITLTVIVVSLLGLSIDVITYYPIYSKIQICLQSATAAVIISSMLVLVDEPRRKYPIAFALASYGVVVNILLTSILAHTFTSFPNFTEANVLSRDIFILFLLIAFTGFIIGRNHIFIQGLLFFALLSHLVFIKKELFFIQNAGLYFVASTGFLFAMYFLVGILNDLVAGLEESNELTNALKQAETNKKVALSNYQNALLNVAKDLSMVRGDLPLLFQKVCAVVSKELPASRVSIWSLENNKTNIVRKYLHESSVGCNSPLQLDRKDIPGYFKALEDAPFILALDACEHSATMEFKDTYLKPLSIVSLLDCPIVVNGEPIGIICCENQFSKSDWGTEEVIFIQAMAENISICYKNLEIINLVKEIREANYELIEKSNEIETMNEELTAANESLEDAVKWRTHELELQNKQLAEYAFINSHLLRAPLSRIMGLSHLLTREVTSIKDSDLISELAKASKELDIIIRTISDILYDGNKLNREAVQTIMIRNPEEFG